MVRNATPIPAIIPDDSWDRTICIPASPLFLAIVAGILKSLTYRYFWQGTPEQIDAVTERMTRMFYEYQDQNGDCMDWCQIIADCINDPDSLASQALRDQFGGNGYPVGTNLPNGKQNANIITAANPTCDLDMLYGQCVYLVRTCNQLIVDFLERLDAINTAELSVELVSRFPIIDEMGGDVVIAYAQFLADAIPENYVAQYDTALEINMACGLFCIAKDTCELSINDVADYFAERLGVSISAITLEELLTALAGASLDGDYVVMAFYALIWKGLALANAVLGQRGDSVLNNALKLGAGDPSDDWIINCEECAPEWVEYPFNTAYDRLGWTALDNNEGVYGNAYWFGNYWGQSYANGTSDRQCRIEFPSTLWQAGTQIRVVGVTSPDCIFSVANEAQPNIPSGAFDITVTLASNATENRIDMFGYGGTYMIITFVAVKSP